MYLRFNWPVVCVVFGCVSMYFVSKNRLWVYLLCVEWMLNAILTPHAHSLISLAHSTYSDVPINTSYTTPCRLTSHRCRDITNHFFNVGLRDCQWPWTVLQVRYDSDSDSRRQRILLVCKRSSAIDKQSQIFHTHFYQLRLWNLV